jgi:hypothetical protein
MSQYQTAIRYRYTTTDAACTYKTPVIDAPDMTTATAQAMVSFFYMFEIGHVRLLAVHTDRLTPKDARERTAIFGSTLFDVSRRHNTAPAPVNTQDDYADWARERHAFETGNSAYRAEHWADACRRGWVTRT